MNKEFLDQAALQIHVIYSVGDVLTSLSQIIKYSKEPENNFNKICDELKRRSGLDFTKGTK